MCHACLCLISKLFEAESLSKLSGAADECVFPIEKQFNTRVLLSGDKPQRWRNRTTCKFRCETELHVANANSCRSFVRGWPKNAVMTSCTSLAGECSGIVQMRFIESVLTRMAEGAEKTRDELYIKHDDKWSAYEWNVSAALNAEFRAAIGCWQRRGTITS